MNFSIYLIILIDIKYMYIYNMKYTECPEKIASFL